MRRVIIAGALALASATAACSGGSSDQQSGADLEVEAVFSQVTEALAAGVYHGVRTRTGTLDGHPLTTRLEIWVDAAAGTARRDEWFGDEPSGITFVTGKVAIRGDQVYLPADGCHGANGAVGLLLGCPEPNETATFTARRTKEQGRDVIVLTSKGTSSGGDQSTTFTTELVLDATTALPIADRTQGDVDDGKQHEFRSEGRYEGGLSPRTAATTRLMAASAKGWPLPGTADSLPADLPPYWLGANVTLQGHAGLALGRIERGSAGGPGYAAIVRYDAVDNPSRTDVMLQLFTPAGFEQARSAFPAASGCEGAPPRVRGGTVGYRCTTSHLFALITFRDAVVLLQPTRPGPLGTPDGLVQLVRQLRHT